MTPVRRGLLLASLVAFTVGIGCSGSASTSANPTSANPTSANPTSTNRTGAKTADDEGVTRLPSVPDDGPAVSSEGKKWDGWRWKGKRNDCHFVHKNRCYESKRSACKAAGCNTSDCRTKGGGPASVSCAK